MRPLFSPEPVHPAAHARAPAPAGPEAAQVLLLCRPGAAVQAVLAASRQRLQLSLASTLGEAIAAVAARPPALAVIDADLCDALDREFVDHLLQLAVQPTVLLLASDVAAPWPPHPRLVRVGVPDFVPAVAGWLAARADRPGAATWA